MAKRAAKFRAGRALERPQAEGRRPDTRYQPVTRVGEPFQRVGGVDAFDREHDGGERYRRLAEHSAPSRFDQAGDRVRAAAEEDAAAFPDDRAVVGDKSESIVESPQGEVALSGAGGAFQQHARPGPAPSRRDHPRMQELPAH
jgi:hypothetical protein